MSSGGSSLQLSYAFVSDPNPIFASVGGANPNTINLTVIISNPTAPDVVTLQGIVIQIPVGGNLGGDLSAAATLPSPVPATAGGWDLSILSGSTIQILPTTGQGTTAQIADTLVFTLPNITVNEATGVVQLAITEIDQNGNATADTSHTLVKLGPNFPVTSFKADPDILTNLEQPVTLTWTCSDQGQGYVYRVYSVDPESPVQPGPNSWEPKKCLQSDDCYNCAAGKAGVTTPPLVPADTTMAITFCLDVIEMDSSGHPTIYETLSTTVRIEIPTFLRSNFIQSPSGWMLQLRWLAINAAKCTIEIDNVLIDDTAPTNTYEQGYALAFTDPPGTQHNILLTACAKSGTAVDTFPFGITINGGATSLNLPVAVTGLAVTPDGTLALASVTEWVAVIDISTLNVEPNLIPIANSPTAIAITPDGTLALVRTELNEVVVINIAQRQAEPNPIMLPFGYVACGIAISPDGTLAFVIVDQGIVVIDIAKRMVKPGIVPFVTGNYSQGNLVLTPDGAHALAANTSANYVVVIDTATSASETIAVSFLPSSIAVTPDSKQAWVSTFQNLTVIDIEKGQADPTTIPIDIINPIMAMSPNGLFAFLVGNLNQPSGEGPVCLRVLDVRKRQVNPLPLPLTVPVPNWPNVNANCIALALTPDRTLVLVSFMDYNNLMLL